MFAVTETGSVAHFGSLSDDFESKFQFHPLKDLPPPKEFFPFPRIYPSKMNRGKKAHTQQRSFLIVQFRWTTQIQNSLIEGWKRGLMQVSFQTYLSLW